MSYRVPQAGDGLLTLHLVQQHGQNEPTYCQLELEDVGSYRVTPSELFEASTWLDSNDLRILAAVLTGFADKIDGGTR